MKHLTIQDLSVTADLDVRAMQAVRGGHSGSAGYYTLPSFDGSKHDFSFSAEQLTSQTQENFNTNGNNVAFSSGINSTFKPTQSNTSTISF